MNPQLCPDADTFYYYTNPFSDFWPDKDEGEYNPWTPPNQLKKPLLLKKIGRKQPPKNSKFKEHFRRKR